MTLRIALVGFGKIARDSHRPAIAADPAFDLVAVTGRSGDPGIGLPWFAEQQDLLSAMAGKLDAVAICTPPGPRHALATAALEAGLAVLLEKPPAATLGEVADLVRLATARQRCLHAGWHSRHAPAVAPAAALLAGQSVRRLAIRWREDVRKWHPGQEWVWEAGGFGVFDPGINALSIATAILPQPLLLRSATLDVPAGRQAPIAARLHFQAGFDALFDWRHGETEEWAIAVETAAGRRFDLLDGGARLRLDGAEQRLDPAAEYPGIYARFAALAADRAVDVDQEPLRIAADAFLIADRRQTAPFQWTDGG